VAGTVAAQLILGDAQRRGGHDGGSLVRAFKGGAILGSKQIVVSIRVAELANARG
jgi:hypothetical protein